MPTREIPASVLWAKITKNRRKLSELGKIGNEAKREKKEKRLANEEALDNFRLLRDLESCSEIALQANEHICPID